MAREGKNIVELAQEILRQAMDNEDFVVPVEKLTMAAETDKGVPTLVLAQKGNDMAFPTNDIADEQIAEYTNIPVGYYRRMAKDAPALLATNVNRWIGDKGDDKRMVRTLDGKVRAFLSDRYRTLENVDLAQQIIPVIQARNLLVISAEITERRMYIKAVDRSIERDVPTGRKMGDGSHVFFDTVSPGITVGNSEVGSGALSVERTVYTRVCTNLAMIGKVLRKNHVGGRVTADDEVFAMLTDETKRLTDEAAWKQVRDVVAAAIDATAFEAHVTKLARAVDDTIEAPQVERTIQRVAKSFKLTEMERTGVLADLIKGADLTRYGLHSAVTRFSQEKANNYDRATELERMGGDIIDLSPAAWRELAVA